MYTVITYKTRQGKDKIAEYIKELTEKAKTSKTERIKLKKIFQYLAFLKEFGTRKGLPIVRHIESEIWELRPTNDRIIFFYWQDNIFVLLHHFKKKTQKMPRKELAQPKKNMQDFKNRGIKK